jgi:hypothetical protein
MIKKLGLIKTLYIMSLSEKHKVDSECRIFQTCLLAILSLLPFDDAGLAMG